MPAFGTDLARVHRVTIAPGASTEVIFRIAKVDCASGAKLTGTQAMTPIVPVTFGDTAPDAEAADRGDGLVTLVGEPAVFPFATADVDHDDDAARRRPRLPPPRRSTSR